MVKKQKEKKNKIENVKSEKPTMKTNDFKDILQTQMATVLYNFLYDFNEFQKIVDGPIDQDMVDRWIKSYVESNLMNNTIIDKLMEQENSEKE